MKDGARPVFCFCVTNKSFCVTQGLFYRSHESEVARLERGLGQALQTFGTENQEELSFRLFCCERRFRTITFGA